ncbi:MAG: hypothetical protein QM733_18105 [Ilumatobacteraceae bacterium]
MKRGAIAAALVVSLGLMTSCGSDGKGSSTTSCGTGRLGRRDDRRGDADIGRRDTVVDRRHLDRRHLGRGPVVD